MRIRDGCWCLWFEFLRHPSPLHSLSDNLGLSLDGKNSPPGRSRDLDGELLGAQSCNLRISATWATPKQRGEHWIKLIGWFFLTLFSMPWFDEITMQKKHGGWSRHKSQSYVVDRNFQTSVHDGILQKKRSKFVARIAKYDMYLP